MVQHQSWEAEQDITVIEITGLSFVIAFLHAGIHFRRLFITSILGASL